MRSEVKFDSSVMTVLPVRRVDELGVLKWTPALGPRGETLLSWSSAAGAARGLVGLPGGQLGCNENREKSGRADEHDSCKLKLQPLIALLQEAIALGKQRTTLPTDDFKAARLSLEERLDALIHTHPRQADCSRINLRLQVIASNPILNQPSALASTGGDLRSREALQGEQDDSQPQSFHGQRRLIQQALDVLFRVMIDHAHLRLLALEIHDPDHALDGLYEI